MFDELRKELYDFYLTDDAKRAKAFADHSFQIMNSRFKEGMSVTAQKLLQYDVIVEEFEPRIFLNSPFFYEMGVLTSLSDGSRNAKLNGLIHKNGWEKDGFIHANGWVYKRNEHLFIDQDPKLYEKRCAQMNNLLYLICGPYNDTSQHFNFNSKPFLDIGAKGIYDKAKRELANAKDEEEKEFLEAVCHGMLSLRRISEKFRSKAEELLKNENSTTVKYNLSLIANTAKRIPWEAPKTFYEALTAIAFLRVAVGSLEGGGPNTFGRLDKDLYPFYISDIESGNLTKADAYKLICQFLITWDCHYDHDMKMIGYADHELENTYTIGGCDDNGNPLCNDLTLMFLKATMEENIIFPKIKCRYSKNSPKEYLDQINLPIINGTSAVIIQNDDATIPALVRAGRPIEEAREYIIAGCWGMATSQEKFDHGSYLNLLKPFEYSIHNLYDKMKEVSIPDIEVLDGSQSFEEIYEKTLRNCERLLEAKLEVTRAGGQIFHKVDRFPIFSSTLDSCIENHKDFTMGGGKYNDDYQLVFGLPNIVDSLMAIKTLVYDEKKYTLEEFLGAVRANFEGYEDLRGAAIKCHGWGDGNEDSSSLASRFNNDLYKIFSTKTGTYGGKVHMGHLTYTEIRWWGEQTLATPDGRRNGEYFAQGLTPSRLKKIPNVGDVVNSLSSLDPSTLAANSVVNIILPSKIPLDRCEGFLRALAGTAIQSLQLNCTSREELLDAQKHPEKYPYLIVRVTGFSAKFTSLSKEWQDEVISRNFYE